ncbi:hypothetical protein [Sphingosinicella sp. BN140058]|uniref:hypothetical protein n=1 Tax=Sphingosinicella sp. BN140058 TaxID=1892855 RepID=UPI001011A742|nr:hypothetical protein [Sphingosinicella sp. BN140058]QAY80132.1 hypothetical protein ETR14_26175 [Sphingosinicella sp. BN140058]
MNRQLLKAVAVTFSLTACGADDAGKLTQPPVKAVTARALKEVDPEAYHKSIEAAVAEIPQPDIQSFQRLFICEMRRNARQPQPKPISADYLRALYSYLKANPAAAGVCSL